MPDAQRQIGGDGYLAALLDITVGEYVVIAPGVGIQRYLDSRAQGVDRVANNLPQRGYRVAALFQVKEGDERAAPQCDRVIEFLQGGLQMVDEGFGSRPRFFGSWHN